MKMQLVSSCNLQR